MRMRMRQGSGTKSIEKGWPALQMAIAAAKGAFSQLRNQQMTKGIRSSTARDVLQPHFHEATM